LHSIFSNIVMGCIVLGRQMNVDFGTIGCINTITADEHSAESHKKQRKRIGTRIALNFDKKRDGMNREEEG